MGCPSELYLGERLTRPLGLSVWMGEATRNCTAAYAPPRLLYEDEIRSVEGPDAGRGGPEGTAPCV